MTGNTQESTKKVQSTFVKVGQNLYRNDSSQTYYGLTKLDGKQFRTALRKADGSPIKDRGLAEDALKKWLGEIGNLSPDRTDESFATIEIQNDKAVLVGGLAKRWLDIQRPNLKPGCIKRYEQHIRGLAPYFENVPVLKISAVHCEDWLTERAYHLAKLTFKHELALLRTIFRWSVERGAMLKDPSRGIKGPRGTPRKLARKKIQIPTKEQFIALVKTIRASKRSARLAGEVSKEQADELDFWAGADLVEFLAYSGCRIGEANALRWRDVDFNAGVIRIDGKQGASDRERGTKNGRDREVPIMSAMFALLQRMHAERNPRPEDFVHPVRSARKCLLTACANLKISPHFTHHDFRHFFVTTCLEAGVPLPTITDWIGHQDGGALALSTYKHIRKDHSLKMAELVDFASPRQLVPKTFEIAA